MVLISGSGLLTGVGSVVIMRPKYETWHDTGGHVWGEVALWLICCRRTKALHFIHMCLCLCCLWDWGQGRNVPFSKGMAVKKTNCSDSKQTGVTFMRGKLFLFVITLQQARFILSVKVHSWQNNLHPSFTDQLLLKFPLHLTGPGSLSDGVYTLSMTTCHHVTTFNTSVITHDSNWAISVTTERDTSMEEDNEMQWKAPLSECHFNSEPSCKQFMLTEKRPMCPMWLLCASNSTCSNPDRNTQTVWVIIIVIK